MEFRVVIFPEGLHRPISYVLGEVSATSREEVVALLETSGFVPEDEDYDIHPL